MNIRSQSIDKMPFLPLKQKDCCLIYLENNVSIFLKIAGFNNCIAPPNETDRYVFNYLKFSVFEQSVFPLLHIRENSKNELFGYFNHDIRSACIAYKFLKTFQYADLYTLGAAIYDIFEYSDRRILNDNLVMAVVKEVTP